MIIAIATMKMNEDVTTQVHVPMDMEVMQVPPTDKEMEKIKSVLEEETGYKFGYELLMLNGTLTFAGLMLMSKKEKTPKAP